MSEAVKRQWLTDNEGVKVAPYTTIDQIITPDGTRFENKYEEDIHNTMQLVYSDSSDTRKTIYIDMTPYKGKIVVLITSGGGLYTIAGKWISRTNKMVLVVNTIKEDGCYVGKSDNTQLVIAFAGIINLFAIK